MAIVEPGGSRDGRRVLALSSPATGEPIDEIVVANADDVKNAVARARAAQPAWGALPVAERASYLEKALAVLVRRQDEFLEIILRESGKTRTEAIMIEIFPSCDSLQYWAKRAPKMLRDEKKWMHLLGMQKRLRMTYRPLGVVGIITPWNGPFVLSANPTVQALVAGNAVLLKPSEVTPRSGQLIADIFEEAGLPKGVLQVLHGDGETGAALLDAGVDKISFTGSVGTGRKVAEACGRNLIPATIELGGKDPMIVCADADLDRAVPGAVFGAFMNTGQVCCSVERVFVDEKIYDSFVERAVELVKSLRVGPGPDTDLGSLFWPQQMEIIERHVNDARERGATIHCGGKRKESEKGLYFEPAVITEVTPDMLIMKEETFGPILPIMRCRDEEEAIRLANDIPYGLSSSVWSKDQARATAIARRIDAGSTVINDSGMVYGALEAPFGGRKTSGVGQANGGAAALRSWSFAQPIVSNRFQVKAEQVWYPFAKDKEEMLQGVIRKIWGTRIGRWMS